MASSRLRMFQLSFTILFLPLLFHLSFKLLAGTHSRLLSRPVMDTFSNIEKERAQLEEHVAKLQFALQHWQKWNFEYEALKEEIAALPPTTTSQALYRAAHDFQGEVLDEKEIRELLGQDKGISRKPEQVVALLSRRIDYVQRNVETVQKQVDGAVIKLGEVGPTEKQDMTEILEELDEQGNVISSRLSRPGEATSEVVNALKKAGVKEDDLQEIDPTIEDKIALDMTTTSSSVTTQGEAPGSASKVEERSASGKQASEEQVGVEGSRRKSVTFAEDTKAESAQSAGGEVQKSSTTKADPVKTKSTRQRIPVIVKNNFEPQDRALEIVSDNDDNDIDESSTQAPIIPADESEADAMIRREMLAYSMNEMGAIVAQLDLAETSVDDDGSYYTDEDDDDEDEDGMRTSATATDDEEENEFGMNATGMMSAQYRQEMQDLEARLNAKYFANLGPDAAGMLDENGIADVEQLATHTARIAVKDDEDMPQRPSRDTSSASAPNVAPPSALRTIPAGSAKKGVRFAEELDVAPPQPAVQAPKATMKTSTPGIRDVVQERTALPSSSITAPLPPSNTRPPSRFKAARSASAQSANPPEAQSPLPTSTTSSITSTTKSPSSRLTTPANSPLAAIVAERPPSSISTATAAAHEPDEFDPELVRRQVAEEYYRQRNRRISKEDGFRREVQEEAEARDWEEEDQARSKRNLNDGIIRQDDQGEDELDEPPQKMSLFRKARLKREMAGGR